MIINERLSNGLKNRFISELHDRIELQLKKFSTDKAKTSRSRSGWGKFKTKVLNHLDATALVIYEGGSARQPYFAYCGLSVDKEREYNSWSEKCVTAVNVITTFNSFHINCNKSNFNISEHAIRRLYQRGDVKVTNETDVEVFSIVEEFRYVPIWASFWVLLLNSLDSKEIINAINPIIPAPNGLFLAELSDGEYPFIEIRTFIGDAELTDDQLLARKIMLEASDNIISCPLVFSPDLEVMGIDIAFPTMLVLAHRLKIIHRVLGDIVFHKLEDKIRQREFIFCLFDKLSELNAKMPTDLSDAYHHPDIRMLHLKINKVLNDNGFHPSCHLVK